MLKITDKIYDFKKFGHFDFVTVGGPMLGIDSLVDDEYYCFSLDYIKNVYLKLSNKEKEFAKTFILFCSNRKKEVMNVIEKLF